MLWNITTAAKLSFILACYSCRFPSLGNPSSSDNLESEKITQNSLDAFIGQILTSSSIIIKQPHMIDIFCFCFSDPRLIDLLSL